MDSVRKRRREGWREEEDLGCGEGGREGGRSKGEEGAKVGRRKARKKGEDTSTPQLLPQLCVSSHQSEMLKPISFWECVPDTINSGADTYWHCSANDFSTV